MNKSYRVITLVSFLFSIYIVLSFLSQIFEFSWKPWNKVNLVNELFLEKEKQLVKHPFYPIQNKTRLSFELYKKPNFITNFNTRKNNVALPKFVKKLYNLKKTQKGKIKIAYFGDSMIEGDLLTQTLRHLLQKEFGGYGVGFLTLNSKVSKFRQTASVNSSGWETINFMDKGAKNLYISGYSFSGKGQGQYTDNTVGSSSILQKFIIYGKTNEGSIFYDKNLVTLKGENLVNVKLLSSNTSKSFMLKSESTNIPFYGISFESENGVILDNFSFRGITGVEFKKIDENFLKAVQRVNDYDLIVLQYGVNLLFRPNDTDYSYYEKTMSPILKKFKSAFPDADILLVSSADRAFRYNGKFETALGIPNLLETQAKMAYDNQLSFFNLFETMGGTNSIVNWASQRPPLANKDYIHPNSKGTTLLAQKLFKAMMNDYKNYQPKKEIKK